jgi:hypothetical protein
MKKKLIKTILLIVLLLLAIVLGMIIGDVCSDVKGLSWLAAGATFGLQPTTLDLSVIQFTFGLTVNINVAQAILLLVAILAYCAIRVRD